MVEDSELVAACGLYCKQCGSYKKGKCPGCRFSDKAKWCKIKKCCEEKKCHSCADCIHFDYIEKCKTFNNTMGKVVSFFTGSDRHACILRIRQIGYPRFAIEMDMKHAHAINDKNRNEKSIWDDPNVQAKL